VADCTTLLRDHVDADCRRSVDRIILQGLRPQAPHQWGWYVTCCGGNELSNPLLGCSTTP